jgi:hypothetical protein
LCLVEPIDRNKVKNVLMFVLCSISVTFACAQDLIVKHDGQTLSVKVNYLTESNIVFTTPGETDADQVGKAEVEKIIYKSGRTELISKKVEIHGIQDWQKIVLTNNPLSVVGLTKKGEIHTKVSKNVSSMASYEPRDVEKMKKQAAGMGAHVIVLGGYDANHESRSTGSERVVLAYGYQ